MLIIRALVGELKNNCANKPRGAERDAGSGVDIIPRC